MDDSQKPGLLSGGQVSRREVLKKGLIGAAGLTVLPAVVAACNRYGISMIFTGRRHFKH